MKFLVFRPGGIKYHVSGKSVNRRPMKHIARTLKDYELFFVENGVLHIKQQDSISAKRGDVVVHIKDGDQCGTAYSENAFYWLHFGGEVRVFSEREDAKKYAEEIGGVCFADYFKPNDYDFAVSLLNEINRLRFDADASAVLDALTNAVLAEFARNSFEPENGYRGNKRVSEIVQYIKLNLDKEITADSLAEIFSYNAKYLAKMFSKAVGQPLGKFLEEQRIERAKSLLLAVFDGIKTIAAKIGYSDEFYFMRVFKKITHTTPTKWRKLFNDSIYT